MSDSYLFEMISDMSLDCTSDLLVENFTMICNHHEINFYLIQTPLSVIDLLEADTIENNI